MKAKKEEKVSSRASSPEKTPMKSSKTQKLSETPLNSHERAPTEYVGNKIKYRDMSQETSEILAYSTHINQCLPRDSVLSKILPLNIRPGQFNLFDKVVFRCICYIQYLLKILSL
jgi:hypothetical protein